MFDVHLRVFHHRFGHVNPFWKNPVRKVPAFDATKKFYERVGSLEDVKHVKQPGVGPFWGR